MVGALLVGIGLWLWPIGFGGRMPVGGDVTQFSLGPMSVLSRALRDRRVPLWNDLWGYGFPGVGESQMGVFYPPHWLLYGLLETEKAYTASLIVHTLWGGLGAYFAARRFGASEVGSAVGGFSWSTCGFFLIHLPHQWGYTTGCWMPWAWGLAWSVSRRQGPPREPFLLALVLTVQLLPGHFQLAFCTDVGILVMAAVRAVEVGRLRKGSIAGVVRTVAAVCGSFGLAAVQLLPTYRLARLAAPRRDFEYLSGFASSPLHLVSFLTPGLFQRSPLWRPLVWDPFHTAPEEYLGFVGLVPLFLALGAVWTGFRRSPAVRALAVVGLVTMVFSLGPYVPGFRFWCGLPGFSFFRAPARWTLAASLALSCLAALGFDGFPTWKRPARALIRFAVAGLAIPALVVLTVEVGLASTARPGWPAVASLYEQGFRALPWHERSAFAKVSLASRRPNTDLRVEEAWARQGVILRRAPRPVFLEQRFAVYRQELSASALILAALIVVAPLARRRGFPAVLIVLTALDLGWQGRRRRFDLGPIEPLVAQSPTLAKLASSPHGLRSIDTLRNMPMVAGAASVSAYRTLDLPALETVTALAGRLPTRDSDAGLVLDAFRLTGAGVRVFDPLESRELERRGNAWPGDLQDVRDPALAGWRFGADWVAQQGAWATRFRLGTLPLAAGRAWLVPLTRERSAAILGEWSGNPAVVLNALRNARPIDDRSTDPEHVRLAFHCDGPALVVWTELADPEWRAVLRGPGGVRAVTIDRAFGRVNQGAWQAVHVPGTGDWVVRRSYRGRDVSRGFLVSGAALTVLATLFLRYGRGASSEESEEP